MCRRPSTRSFFAVYLVSPLLQSQWCLVSGSAVVKFSDQPCFNGDPMKFQVSESWATLSGEETLATPGPTFRGSSGDSRNGSKTIMRVGVGKDLKFSIWNAGWQACIHGLAMPGIPLVICATFDRSGPLVCRNELGCLNDCSGPSSIPVVYPLLFTIQRVSAPGRPFNKAKEVVTAPSPLSAQCSSSGALVDPSVPTSPQMVDSDVSGGAAVPTVWDATDSPRMG